MILLDNYNIVEVVEKLIVTTVTDCSNHHIIKDCGIS